MSAIFFDLETSQKDFIGQILNFAFVQVDDHWNEVSKHTGEIKISPLELPHPKAILANRIDVLAHQKNAELTEPKAMKEISQYLGEVSKGSRKADQLIGFNSARFDVPYLRTSMIRNGINPYIKGIDNKDLLHLVRYLSATDSSFPRMEGQEANRLSLRLETISQAFNLLQGQQTHNSLDDVYLTIDLAKHLATHYAIDVRKFDSYRVPTGLSKFDLVKVLEPNYDLTVDRLAAEKTYVFLDEDRGGSLWVDAEAYSEEADWCTRWVSKKAGALFVDEQESIQLDDDILSNIKKTHKKSTLKNYFSKSTCDIEQDIYRLDFDARDELTSAIWHDTPVLPKEMKHKEAKVLYIRYLLKENGVTSNTKDIFQKYVRYRFGGKIKMNKSDLKDETLTHPSFQDLVCELGECKSESSDPQDLALLDSLETFYNQSEIARFAR